MRPPSIDTLARALAADDDLDLPHPILVDVARAAVAERADDATPDDIEADARRRAQRFTTTLLKPVVNATGVLLHTNLGRAPLAASTTGRATNLEFDLRTGRRGNRRDHAGTLLARAVDAEAAIVVNNCASAVLLTLAALARGEGVAVSRGELVEIGGSFRIPDVMAESGARLVEVGTTNRTRVADYAAAAERDDVAYLLKVHRSNYTIEGFTEEATIDELAAVGPPVLVDLGSGFLDAACPWLHDGPPAWLRDEPAAKQTLAAGAHLVLFSGDKLLGGPQAGIIAGRADLVDAIGRHPLYRALRPGGLTLAALQDVALAYLDRTADALPFWRMATVSTDDLERRATAIAAIVAANDGPRTSVEATEALPGGGTLPHARIPSIGLAVDGDHARALRQATPPVIARVDDGTTVCDLRTVDPADDAALTEALAALGPG